LPGKQDWITNANLPAGNSKEGNTNLSFTEASISEEPSAVVPHAYRDQLIGVEEFINQMVDALGIIIDRCPKRKTS
jgi:hypothetical protein